MIPSHIGAWRRFLKKLLLVSVCIALILFLTSLDPGTVDGEQYGSWDWSTVELVTWLSNMSRRMEERRQHLHEICMLTGLAERLNDSLHKPNVWEFLISTPHHLVWCNVFKAASTSWMYNFNILAGYKSGFLQSTKQVPLQLARKRYPRPSLAALREAQNHSITFLIVRHPLERLLSGYRDKIENALAHTYHQKLNMFIITHYRRKESARTRVQRKSGRKAVPKFSEFVDFLIDQYHMGRQLDMHWTPINGFCTPCQVEFDIIMKFETLEEDQNYLIHIQKLEQWIRPQWKNPSKGRSRTSNLIKKYYSQLTKHQIQKLEYIYRYDLQLFNYTLDGYINHAKDNAD